MDIRVGDTVSVRHYSGDKLLRGLVVGENLDALSIKLTNAGDSANCSKGEPVVLGFESESIVYIASCDIIDIDRGQDILILEIASIETLLNKRASERFPVSLQAEIKIGESSIIHSAIIKNISFTGMLMSTQSDFALYQKLKISMYIGSQASLQAVVVRKVKEGDRFDYGLKIVFTDTSTPAILRRYLSMLKREQEIFIKKFASQQNMSSDS